MVWTTLAYAVSAKKMNELLASNDDLLAILHGAMVRDLDQPRDADETHAILFGVICGWHEALPEVAEKFGWSEDDIENIARLQVQTQEHDRRHSSWPRFWDTNSSDLMPPFQSGRAIRISMSCDD